MRKVHLLGLVLLLLVLSACSAAESAPPTTKAPDAARPAAGQGAPSPSAPDAVQAALFAIVSQLRVSYDHLSLVRWEAVEWPDGCLGVPMRDACAAGTTPGYRLIVTVDGQRYEYHATRVDAEPFRVLLAEGPDPALSAPVLIWEGAPEGEGCRSLSLAADGRAAVGPCDAPQTGVRLIGEMNRPEEWAQLQARFAPFQANGPQGRIDFRGTGREQASLAWQRAMTAWAELVGAELAAGRGGASWGLALSWQEPDLSQEGHCRFLEVSAYGRAWASMADCGGGDPSTLRGDWLTTEELEQLDAWLQARQPLLQEDLLVSSTGATPWSDAEIEALRAWAAGLYRRLERLTPLAAKG